MGLAMDNDGIHSGNSRGDTPTLGGLLQGILPVPEEMDRAVGQLRLSSSSVVAGDVFIALPGVTADGRDYISQAVERGASAVLFEAQDAQCESGQQGSTAVIGIFGLKTLIGEIASRYHGVPSRNLQITGVTGTNGKTTVAYLLAQALERLGGHCGYIGTLGTGFLDGLEDSELTTLDAISAHARLREFSDRDATHAAIEVSSHGLDQGRANGIEFDVAIFTNLSQDHLDYHGSMDRYGQAKRKLFEFESLKCAVINADDPFGQELVDFCDSQELRRITYGMHTADLVPTSVSLDTSGSKFSIEFGSENFEITTRLLGEVNVPNTLAVVGALLALGWAEEQIAPVMAELEPPPGRMEVFRGVGDGPTVVVDYAHTPDALERALVSLQVLSPGRVFAVFGCGGDRDQDKRPKMGQIAQQHADVCIVTDDNPRTEPPQQIVEQILGGMSADVQVVHDRIAAVRTAINMAEPDDVILLAGKGHEGYQDIGSEVLDLSDREFVARLLEELQ